MGRRIYRRDIQSTNRLLHLRMDWEFFCCNCLLPNPSLPSFHLFSLANISHSLSPDSLIDRRQHRGHDPTLYPSPYWHWHWTSKIINCIDWSIFRIIDTKVLILSEITEIPEFVPIGTFCANFLPEAEFSNWSERSRIHNWILLGEHCASLLGLEWERETETPRVSDGESQRRTSENECWENRREE